MRQAKIPQRKPNRTMTADQMLTKAMTGTHVRKNEKELKEKELQAIIDK